MHPVIQDSVLVSGADAEKKNREQDPSDGIAWATGGEQGAHCYRGDHDRGRAQPVGYRSAGPGPVRKAVEWHDGQIQAEREHAERDRYGRCRPPGCQDLAHNAPQLRGPE